MFWLLLFIGLGSSVACNDQGNDTDSYWRGDAAVDGSAATEAGQPPAADGEQRSSDDDDGGAEESAVDRDDAMDLGSLVGVGAADHCDEMACREEAEDQVSFLEMPALNEPPAFVDAECIATEPGGQGTACDCIDADGGAVTIGPVGGQCFARGRAGSCLWGDSEYTPCDLQQPDSCDAVCEELERRYVEDGARTYDVDLRYTGCVDSICHSIVEIDDSCYVDHSYRLGLSYSCTLSDAEILEAALGTQGPGTSGCEDEPDMDAGATSCFGN